MQVAHKTYVFTVYSKIRGNINIKMFSQYRNSHYKDKTVVRRLIFIMDTLYQERRSWYWDKAQVSLQRGQLFPRGYFQNIPQ